MSDFDYTDLHCPLPVLRVHYEGDGVDVPEVLLRTTETCNNPLGVITTGYQYATVGGVVDGANPHWEVRCDAGHVVFTYDDEGNDYDVPFDHEELRRALHFLTPDSTAIRLSPTAALMDNQS